MTLRERYTPPKDKAKKLGAYYTPDLAVAFMTKWALWHKEALVIDPSFGNGQFLRAAAEFGNLKNPSEQIFGVELDKVTYDACKKELAERYHLKHLWQSDFFLADSFFEDHFGASYPVKMFDAVLGNPPFIRYQSYNGEARQIAFKRAHDAGITMPGHASLWAPFLIHSISLVKEGGRMAMVIPAELNHAAYAKGILAFLQRSFGSLDIISFRKKLFSQLGEDTLIVLAAKYGQAAKHIFLHDLEDEKALASYSLKSNYKQKVNLEPNGTQRLSNLFLDEPTLALYQTLKTHSMVKELGELAEVGIGYVTGDNQFFHVSTDTIKRYRIPKTYLKRCVRKGGQLKGLELTEADWTNLATSKWLLAIPKHKLFERLPKGVKAYLHQAEERGVLKRYKVKSRDPWYSVPHIKQGDLLLSYMANGSSRLATNPNGFLAPNSLHTVRLKGEVGARRLALAWYTSLSFLSAELEGHSLGGGMLKLEPKEAQRVVVALSKTLSDEVLEDAYYKIDNYLRHGDVEAALDIGDTLILGQGLNLKKKDCQRLRQGYKSLRDRRMNR